MFSQLSVIFWEKKKKTTLDDLRFCKEKKNGHKLRSFQIHLRTFAHIQATER